MTTAKPITPEDVVKRTQEWQATPENAIPNLFNAYDAKLGATARVVAFSIKGDNLISFLSYLNLNSGNTQKIKLHMGVNEIIDPKVITEIPGFMPILQFQSGDSQGYDNCWALAWEPSFSINSLLPSVSPAMAEIPIQAAFSFIYEWDQLPFNSLAGAFVGFTGERISRIKSSIFGQEDVTKILAFAQDNGQWNPNLELHFYIGILQSRNILHPYTFSPVLQISAPAQEKKKPLFFEFSSPCPPRCDD